MGFADLPTNYDQSIFELHNEHRPLPDGLEGSGIFVQGHNRSDDLFMFLKRRVDGLRPNTSYAVSVSVDLATNVPAGSFGIGGSPGGSVFVKAGASTAEPLAGEDGKGYLRMNIDKGNQSRGGESMVVVGNVAHPEVANKEYRIKTLDNTDRPLSVTTDSKGGVWLIIGTDSGFEGLTQLYYDRISYALSSVEPPTTGGYAPPIWTLALAGGFGAAAVVLGLVAMRLPHQRRGRDAGSVDARRPCAPCFPSPLRFSLQEPGVLDALAGYRAATQRWRYLPCTLVGLVKPDGTQHNDPWGFWLRSEGS